MKYIALIVTLLLVGCSDASPTNMLTYEQLVAFEPSCAKKDTELKQLLEIQRIKNFPQDPDDIKNEMDRAYNSRLKATIWWYTYRCEQ